MRARLLFRDKDFGAAAPPPWNDGALLADLELRRLFEAMAQGDGFILTVARAAILSSLGNDVETIRYRQDVLRDCLAHSDVIREMYAIIGRTVERDTDRTRSSLARDAEWVLGWASRTIAALLDDLERLRGLAERHGPSFRSEGLGGLASMLESELSADYCASVRDHLRRLRFRDGLLLGAGLGKGNKGSGYVLLPPHTAGRERWLMRLPWLARLVERVTGRELDPFSFTLDPLDQGGAVALASLRNRGLASIATALGEAAEYIQRFLDTLHAELGFYVGCLNLHEQLRAVGVSVSVPVPARAGTHGHAFKGLVDPVLALTTGRRPVGNDVAADGKDLILVTGANQGGKSTFLRSIGLAQLMMQSGMFVAADTFSSSLVDGLSTHFRREEDAAMVSGKFDEELGRMSEIIDHVTPHTMILLNESFAATNEREGSEIARQIVSALMRRRVRMICVTHLYELARGLVERNDERVLFLRAERREDGARTFKIVEGPPLRTSFGVDLYNEIFRVGDPVPVESRSEG